MPEEYEDEIEDLRGRETTLKLVATGLQLYVVASDHTTFTDEQETRE